MVREAKSRNSRRTKEVERPSPISRIGKIGALKKYENREQANVLLHEAAKLVAPIIHEYNLRVGTLCEMYPKSANLLGLNVNKGQKILLRLRYPSNVNSFYPMTDIVGTLLHELTHNTHGSHDAKFYKYLDTITRRFEDLQMNGGTSTYVCEEQKLGSKFNAFGGYESVRDRRIKALSKTKYKAESRRLGTSSDKIQKTAPLSTRPVRELMLIAAERRLKDNKWCGPDESAAGADVKESDLEIVDVAHSPSMSGSSVSMPKSSMGLSGSSVSTPGSSKLEEVEVIVIEDD